MKRQQPRVPSQCPPGFRCRYTVKTGDSIFSIARRYHISVVALVAANPHIADPNVIYPGDVLCVPGGAEQPTGRKIILATTTSTVDTGLLDFLIPRFTEDYGYNVQVLSVGTGEALRIGAEGRADVLLTHAPDAERVLVDSAYVINYRQIMYNDFIIVGAPSDPADIRGVEKASDAFRKIADRQALFFSRGDDSGTNLRELKIWTSINVNPESQTKWYRSTGTGMSETLLAASRAGGYTVSDRGTYLAMMRNTNLDIMVQGDPVLLNIYHVMQPNPAFFQNVNAQGGLAFIDFMTSPSTQEIIRTFGTPLYGEPLFIPIANVKG